MFRRKAAISTPDPGRLAGQMKWHIARYPRPVGTLIKLGSVLTDPYDPETSINRNSAPIPIDPTDLSDQSDAIQTAIIATTSERRSASTGADAPTWAPLIDMGVLAEVERTKDYQVIVNTEAVTAQVFLPAEQWLSNLLKDPQIVRHIQEHFFPTLYVIIGVATASRVSISEKGSRGYNTTLSSSASITPAGVGANVGVSDGACSSTSAKYSTPPDRRVDFAYRVRKFEYSKVRRKLKAQYKDITEGALMDFESFAPNYSIDQTEDEGEEYIPVYKYLDEKDFDGEEPSDGLK
ncbi:hypothetical protein TWF730_000124 [Orbilia blumenaviensis]|uniref:Uncharacterized protein n=1 Tax=Orbilia blumenaviensis TaxID=1796055 RepID=A0AAV9VRR4_9PEZI